MIQGKGAAKRIAHGWGPGGDQSVKRFKERSQAILEEYLVSNPFSCFRRPIVVAFLSNIRLFYSIMSALNLCPSPPCSNQNITPTFLRYIGEP